MVDKKLWALCRWLREGPSQLESVLACSHGACPTGAVTHSRPPVEYPGQEAEVLSRVLNITQCGMDKRRSSYGSV